MDRNELRGDLIGMVLGDGSLWRNVLRDRKTPSGNAVLSISHGHGEFGYLAHKRDRVQVLFDYEIPIYEREVTAERGGKTYTVFRFNTRSHAFLEFIRQRIYVPEKRITDWALNAITNRGIAYWWMDDGCLHQPKLRPGRKQERFAIWGLYGFPLEDVIKLRGFICERFGVTFNLNQHRSGGWVLRVGGCKAMQFLDQIAEYAAPGMTRKFHAI